MGLSTFLTGSAGTLRKQVQASPDATPIKRAHGPSNGRRQNAQITFNGIIASNTGQGSVYLGTMKTSHSDERRVTIKVPLTVQHNSCSDSNSTSSKYGTRAEYDRMCRAYYVDPEHVPNPIRIIENPSGSEPILVMDYIKGLTLHELLQHFGTRQEPMPLRALAHVMAQLSRGLQYIQEKTICHRDIKPSNIMITDNGAVKILDFGISKEIPESDCDEPEPTSTFPLMTPRYSAPERFISDTHATTDVYSLGIIALEMLSPKLAKQIQNKIVALHTTIANEQILPTDYTQYNAQIAFVIDEVLTSTFDDNYPLPPGWKLNLQSLLSKMLEGDASKRLTLEQVAYAWTSMEDRITQLSSTNPSISAPLSKVSKDIVKPLHEIKLKGILERPHTNMPPAIDLSGTDEVALSALPTTVFTTPATKSFGESQNQFIGLAAGLAIGALAITGAFAGGLIVFFSLASRPYPEDSAQPEPASEPVANYANTTQAPVPVFDETAESPNQQVKSTPIAKKLTIPKVVAEKTEASKPKVEKSVTIIPSKEPIAPPSDLREPWDEKQSEDHAATPSGSDAMISKAVIHFNTEKYARALFNGQSLKPGEKLAVGFYRITLIDHQGNTINKTARINTDQTELNLD